MTEQYKYRVGGSLPINAPTYVTRQADQDFYEGLNAGAFCYVLNARQTGKSSLLWRTKNRLEVEGVQCAVIDLSSIGRYQMTSDKWYATLIRKLVNDFGFTNEFDQSAWWRDREQLSPIYRFSEFIETVLLAKVEGRIIIFLDEIDSVLRFEFKDDFFTAIRAFFNKRAENSEYDRLTFSLLGVATPTDLIEDKEQTPFNIGQAIELTGFQLDEVQPLIQGLAGKVSKPREALEEILQWTGGHPFLTQKLCSLLLQELNSSGSTNSDLSIENIVNFHIIDNWEAQDYPEHLKTICNRLIANEKRTGRLLGLYRRILDHPEESLAGHGATVRSPSLDSSRLPSHPPDSQAPGILANSHPDQMTLRLTGLVIKQQGRLKVYNRIYASIFDQAWISRELSNLRPYYEALNAWVASEYKDESRLLRGAALKEAQAWVTDKSLDTVDDQFLAASLEKAFEAERQANQILSRAKQRAIKRVQVGSLILVTSLLTTGVLAHKARNAVAKAESAAAKAESAESKADDAQKKTRDAELSLKITKAENDKLNGQNKEIRVSLERAEADKRLAKLQANEARERADEARGREQKSKVGEEVAKAETARTQIIAEGAEGRRKKADKAREKADKEQRLTEKLAVLERKSTSLLATFEKDSRSQLDTLLIAVENGKELQEILSQQQREEYANSSAISTLQAILDNIQEHQRFNHKEWVWSISISSDGKRLATAGHSRKIRIQNLNPNSASEEEIVLEGHDKEGPNGEILSVQFNPKDSNQIAIGSADGTVRLWNVETKQQIPLFSKNQGKILSVDFSPDGKRVAAAGDDGIVRVWNPDTGQLTNSFEAHSSRIFKINFDPSPLGGERIATASLDGTARVWDVSTGRQIVEFKHKGMVLGVSFSPDGKKLATAEDSGLVYLWDVWSQREIAKFPAHLGWVMSVHFSPDGKQLVTTGLDFAARVWTVDRIRSNADVADFKAAEFRHRGVVTDARFHPDGDQLATTGLDQTTRLWKLPQTVELAEKELVKKNVLTYRVLFSPVNNNLIAVTGSDGRIKLQDASLTPGKVIQELDAQGWVSSMSFDPTGTQLATATFNGVVKIWDTSSREIITTLPEQEDLRLVPDAAQAEKLPGVSNVSFSHDGKQLAVAYLGGVVRLWDLELHRAMFKFKFKADRIVVSSMSFSPDGNYLATTGFEGKVQLWDIRSGKQINDGVFQEPNRRTLSEKTRSEGTIRRILSVSFSPKLDEKNRNIIALATSDGLVQLWKLNSKPVQFFSEPIEKLAEFQAHAGSVLNVIFNPDGTRVASLGVDGAIRIWAVASLIAPKEKNSILMSDEKLITTQSIPPQIAEFKAKRSFILSISFNANGNQIATAEVESGIQLRKIESLEELIARGCNWLRGYSKAKSICESRN